MTRLWCRWFGHRWMGLGPFEHLCIQDQCWRCGTAKWVHLYGPWPHTCGQRDD